MVPVFTDRDGCDESNLSSLLSGIRAQEEGGDEFAEFADEPAPLLKQLMLAVRLQLRTRRRPMEVTLEVQRKAVRCSVGFISHSESVISSSFWHSPSAWFHYS